MVNSFWTSLLKKLSIKIQTADISTFLSSVLLISIRCSTLCPFLYFFCSFRGRLQINSQCPGYDLCYVVCYCAFSRTRRISTGKHRTVCRAGIIKKSLRSQTLERNNLFPFCHQNRTPFIVCFCRPNPKNPLLPQNPLSVTFASYVFAVFCAKQTITNLCDFVK